MEIFVNNLSYQIEEDELRDVFAPFGDVRRVTVVRDRETGRPRGFGFVDMSNPEAAQQAIAALNGKILQGRPLVVSEARPREPAGSRGPRPPAASSAGQPVFGSAPRPWTPQPRPAAPPGLPPLPDRRREPGGAESADADSPETELQEQRRRTLARIASFAKQDKRKGERFEEGKRRVLKGAEKGRHNKVAAGDDDDDELDELPVRIR